VPRPDKDEVYRQLGRAYRYTPDEIAHMTPYQQLVMLDFEMGDQLHFDTI
jgi:hypothetical protein